MNVKKKEADFTDEQLTLKRSRDNAHSRYKVSVSNAKGLLQEENEEGWEVIKKLQQKIVNDAIKTKALLQDVKDKIMEQQSRPTAGVQQGRGIGSHRML